MVITYLQALNLRGGAKFPESNIESYDLAQAPWLGCLTSLAVYKPCNSTFLTAVLRLSNVVALLIQIVFLCHIVLTEYAKEREEGLCLGNASTGTKLLMSSIAALICMRTIQRALDIFTAYQRFAELRAASPLPLSQIWLYPLMQVVSTCS